MSRYCYFCLEVVKDVESVPVPRGLSVLAHDPVAHKFCFDRSNDGISVKLDLVLKKLETLLAIGYGEVTRRD